MTSIFTNDMDSFTKIFYEKISELYILEKYAKCKLIRKIHKMVLCLNSLVIEYFRQKVTQRNTESTKVQNMFTRFKIMIKMMDTCVVNVLKEKRFGSVEILFTYLTNNKNNVEMVSKNSLLQMLKECANGEFEFTVKHLYQKKQKKNLRYSTSFNLKRPQMETRMVNNCNFLDHDTVDYSRSAINNYSSFVDSEGVLLRDSNFYDASFELVRNFLHVNKLMLSHFIPNLT